jgi:tRNA A37 threonylcarbamoyltransferase TsaD
LDDSIGEAFDKIARLLDLESRFAQGALCHPGLLVETAAR